MSTLNERYANLNRPVRVTVTLPLQTLIKVEGQAREIGLSRQQALGEAVGDWSVRRERSLNRHNRLLVERALEEAKDKEPVEVLLERFRRQMGATAGGEHKDWSEPLTCVPEVPKVHTMTSSTQALTLRQRREALGLSRQRLASLADVSTGSLAQFEGGLIPKESKVLGLIEAALREQERLAA